MSVTDENESERQSRLITDLREFLSTSTVHGLSRITESQNWYARTISIIVFFSFFGAGVYTCYNIIREYFRYEAYLVYKKHNVESLKFPSITLCNANNFKLSEINTHFNNAKFVERLLNASFKENKILPGALYAAAWSFSSDNITLTKERRSGSEALFPTSLEGWCAFRSVINCNREDFIQSLHHSFVGLCKTFNSNGKYAQINTGPLSGLLLKLFINQAEYASMIPFDIGAGVNVIVHPQDVLPDTTKDGILIQPGTLTRIVINRRVLRRLPSPYPSDCENRKGTDFLPGRYTVINCHQSCLHAYMYKKCGIMDSVVRYNLKEKGKNFPEWAGEDKKKDLERCTLDSYTATLSKEISCHCPLPCEEEKFITRVSSSKWPTNADLRYYKPILARILNKTEVTDDFIYDNMLSVQIYFEGLDYEEAIEVPAISNASIFGSIGGAIGLFIGASCYSVVEFLQFIINTLVHHFHRKGRVEP